MQQNSMLGVVVHVRYSQSHCTFGSGLLEISTDFSDYRNEVEISVHTGAYSPA